MLLLDIAPGHPVNVEESTNNIRVIFMPPNTTSILQPMDQGVISTFKAYYLRRTMRQLVENTDSVDKSNVRQFWKEFNIKKAVDNIGHSWAEITLTNMNRVWKNIWPECTTDDFLGESVPEIKQEIVEMAREAGFNEVEIDDVIELLDSHGRDLSNDDLVELNLQIIRDETVKDTGADSPNLKKLTNKRMSEAFNLIGAGMDILITEDPNTERSIKCSRIIENGLYPYHEVYKENKKQAVQTNLLSFLNPKKTDMEIIKTNSANEI